MQRQQLAVPLLVLVAVVLLLAAATALGAIPSPLSIALISGVVASILTGGLGLLGVWMTLRYQADSDRYSRLREAYAKLLRAADLASQAANELMLYPKGRPYPGLVGPAPSDDYWRYEPFHVAEEAIGRAGDLFAEAEVEIFLDEGDDSQVLKDWQQIQSDYHAVNVELAATKPDLRKVAAARDKVFDSVETLRSTAHRRIQRMRAG